MPFQYIAIEGANNAGTTRVSLRDSIVTGNGAGISSQKGVRAVNTVITGNGVSGISDGNYSCETSALVVLKSSTVTGPLGNNVRLKPAFTLNWRGGRMPVFAHSHSR